MVANAPPSLRRMAGWLPWVLLALALVTRFYGILYHSLWFDEVVSTQWAARSVQTIWRVGMALSEDKHPPLYYLALHFWTRLFGPGDLAVRSLGAVVGALAVLPTYGLGRLTSSRRAGLIAALLLALNPFLVWYSQEARMFMPATTLALAALYALLAGWRAGEAATRWPGPAGAARMAPRALLWYAVFVLCMTAALYTFLYTAFILPVAGAWLLWLWWCGRGRTGNNRRLLLGIASLVVTGLLFLPFASAAWRVSGAEATHGRAFQGMLPVLPALLRVYTWGWPRWPASSMDILTGAAGILALAGVLWPNRAQAARRERWGGVWLALWLGIVILCGGILLSREARMFAETRYQIVLAPALCLAWGRALAGLWTWRRPAGGLATGLMVAALVVALPWDWRPENRREAWREAAALLDAQAAPNDAVLIYPDYVHVALERYLPHPHPLFYPFTDKITDPATVDPPLAGLAGFNAVWLVESHHEKLDPNNIVAGWFGARFPEVTELYPTGIAIHVYAQHYRTPTLPAGVPRLDATLGRMRLLGCAYTPQALPARDEVLHPPSNWIHVTTYWTPGEAATSARADALPVVRMVDAGGQVWGERLDRPNDAFHIWPPARWVPGEVVRADTDVNLNPVTPAGVYRLVVQLPGAAGEGLCGKVKITP